MCDDLDRLLAELMKRATRAIQLDPKLRLAYRANCRMTYDVEEGRMAIRTANKVGMADLGDGSSVVSEVIDGQLCRRGTFVVDAKLYFECHGELPADWCVERFLPVAAGDD